MEHTVLIIEDSVVEQKVMHEALKHIAKVITVSTGREGLKKALHEKVCLIILDLHLPDMSGKDICKKLKESIETRFIPIVVITSYTDEEEECFNLGASEFIAKPVKRAILQARVNIQFDIINNRVIDPLTKIHNRVKLHEVSIREISRSRRYHIGLCLLIFDVDDFKGINDKYGHFIGDCVLQYIANLYRLYLRDSDYFIRYGGDEFVVVLMHADINSAIEVGKKMLELVNSFNFVCDNNKVEFPLSISIGIAELNDSDTFQSLFDRADRHLYTAKSLGKSRVAYDKKTARR